MFRTLLCRMMSLRTLLISSFPSRYNFHHTLTHHHPSHHKRYELAVPSLPLRLSSTSSPSTSTAPSESGGGESQNVVITENCAKRLTELLSGSEGKGKKYLRISVEGGGCSGFQYKFHLDDQIQPDDKSFTHPQYEKALVVVDPTSLEYLQGATVDYETELIRSAFKVVQNPKAEHGCSCGASFTVKLD